MKSWGKKNSILPITREITSINNDIIQDISIKSKIKKLIQDTYYNDIERFISGRHWWLVTSNVTETAAKVCAGLSTAVAFAAGFFNIPILPFIAGCLGTLALVLLQFSGYSKNESKERTEQANKLLEVLGLGKLVDVTVDSSDDDNDTGQKNDANGVTEV